MNIEDEPMPDAAPDSPHAEYIPVRLSHLLRYCSVGTIVRGAGDPAYLMVVEDIRKWKDLYGNPGGKTLSHVEGVKSSLDITKELRKPPIARLVTEGKGNRVDGTCIPSRRFPSWMRCPQCGLLCHKPWEAQRNDQPVCPVCGSRARLEQVTWVMVHEAGFMADVPWHHLAHHDARIPDQKQCKADRAKPYLRMEAEDGRGWRVHCGRCHASGPFDEAGELPFGHLTPSQPWTGEVADLPEGAPPAKILQINDTRIHSPVTCAALVIPPESRVRRNTVTDRLYCSSEWRQRLGSAMAGLPKRSEIRLAATHFQCAPKDIEKAMDEIAKGYPLNGRQVTPGDLMALEWDALTKEIPDNEPDEDLVTEHCAAEWRDKAREFPPESDAGRIVAAVDRLVAIRRLKEIQVLKGFTRVRPEQIVPPDLTGEGDWLPAIELYGEGIFLTLDEDILSAWETHSAVRKRAASLKQQFVASARSFHPEVRVTPRFVLLHTLAHLLIREFEAHAGYPAASLKERIYASEAQDARMAGILVYVAVPDVAGSLGGLADLAVPRRFLRHLCNALERARWCSLDPVCSEHEGQGPDQLNRAACHACALVPETSCVCGNLLLDRTFIKGEPSEAGGMPAYLDHVGLALSDSSRSQSSTR